MFSFFTEILVEYIAKKLYRYISRNEKVWRDLKEKERFGLIESWTWYVNLSLLDVGVGGGQARGGNGQETVGEEPFVRGGEEQTLLLAVLHRPGKAYFGILCYCRGEMELSRLHVRDRFGTL
jgi:hypothetical protein